MLTPEHRRKFKPPLTKKGKPCGRCKQLGKRCPWHPAEGRQMQHSRARARVATKARKASFLEAYAEAATVTHASRAAGIIRSTHYRWLNDDPEYAERFEQARAEVVDEVEFAMRRIALGTEHLPSSVRAQQALLRANCPERFGDRVQIQAEHSGQVEFTGIEYVIVDPPAAELVAEPPSPSRK